MDKMSFIEEQVVISDFMLWFCFALVFEAGVLSKTDSEIERIVAS